MEKLDGKTLDIEKSEQEKLKSIFPQCFVEGKLDTTKLLELVGEYDIKDYEKYEFTWHGKSECIKNAQTRSHGTLRPCEEESKNFDETGNLYIEGDNLEVLKLLQKSYYGKVKMIYIDPPYNTGKDFVYKDNFRDNIKNYKEITSQATKSNSETIGRFHTDWLNMMYPRLRLAYNLLKDDGVIFISIDDNEVHNLRKLCDEVFGEENFVGDIIWNSTKSVTNTALISVSHTYNLVYFKAMDYYTKNRNKFRLKDSGEGFENIDNDPRGAWKADPFQVGGWRPNQQYEIINPNTGIVYKPNPNCSWKNDYNKYLELVKDNRIIFGKDGKAGPQRKRFIWEAQERGKVVKTLWTDIETTTNGTQMIKKLFDNTYIFDNPKPISLIKRMVELCTDDNDIILDFFSGSSTTAHAVMELNKEDGGNRKFIMVQLPELTDEKTEAYKSGYKNICEIGKERIRRAGTKINEDNPEVDTGFKVLKLDSSNLKIWDNSPIEDDKQLQIDVLLNRMNEMVDKVKDDRTDLDVVYEILLKLGYKLTENVERTNFSGKTCYIVADGELVVCLDSDVGLAAVEEMIKVKPNTIVFAEDSFAKTEDITNAKLVVGKVLGTENSESIKFKFV